jgi:hypothetical protein
MTWYVKRADDTKGHQQVRFTFLRILPENYNDFDLVFTDKLLQSDDEKPPIYPSVGNIQTNCILTADLRSVDHSLFKEVMGVDRKLYFEIQYDLVVTMQSGAMKFSLEIDGQE